MRERGVAILGRDVVQDVLPSRVADLSQKSANSPTGHRGARHAAD
jgi:hypothetical protein